MNTAVFKEVIQASIDGSMTFPQVVGKLLSENIEAYHVDLVRNENRYYMANGQSHVEKVPLPHAQAAAEFSAEQVKAAIKNVQMQKIDYPQFIEAILKAGAVYYIAYLAGKRVIYLGREGDMHIEYFPGVK